MGRRFFTLIRMAALCLGATAVMQGQIIVWSGAGNRFVDNTNWVGGIAPGPTNLAQFGNHGGNTLILVNSTTIQDLEFLSTRTAVHTFTYDDGTALLTLNGNLTAQTGPNVNFVYNSSNHLDFNLPSGEHVFDIGSATTVTIAGIISGAGHFSKIGAGTLVLNGTNTYNYDNNFGFLDSTSIHAGTLLLDGGSINHSGSGDVQISLSANDSGALVIINGGHVSDYFGVLAQGSNSTATATVTGSGSYWTNSSGMDIGSSGTGTVNILSGADVTITGTFAFLGWTSNGVGTVNVDGVGSTWTIGGELIDGNAGLGLLAITGGGLVSSVGSSLAVNNTSSGTATISGSGSLWSNGGPILVGVNGTGSMSVSAGGGVTNTYSYVGTQAGSHGTVTVNGAGSTWTNSGLLAVGQGGTGTLTITAGGVVSDGFGYIGYAAGSVGTVIVSGAGSLWDNASTLGVGSAGSGALTVANGGTVTFAGGIGTLLLADTAGSSGTLNIGAAAAAPAATGGILNVGAVSTGSGNGTVQFNTTATSGSPYYFTKDSTAGGGAIPIYGSAGVTNTGGYNVLTAANGYTGPTKVTGGTLEIRGGSFASGLYATTIGLNIGDLAGFVISQGASVNSDYSTLGGTGSFAVVNGTGSSWVTNNSLNVGSLGSASLTVSAGGFVTANYTNVGNSGSGSVVVQGTGSSWTNTGGLTVGNAGTGTVAILNGGSLLSANESRIGYGYLSSGSVLVDGASSEWTSQQTVRVGTFGSSGSLTLSNDGMLNVMGGSGNVLLADLFSAVNPSGIFNIGAVSTDAATDGGVVNAAAITTGVGTGVLQFNTTTTANRPYYLTKDGTAGGVAVAITGPTTVVNTAGYNVLAGNNSYTGQTTINGGTLVFGGTSAFGTSSVVINGGTLAVANGVTFGNTFGFGVSGGRLGGNGSFSSPVTLGSGVVIAPGNSPGTLNFLSGLTLNNRGALEIEIRAPSGTPGTDWDFVNVTGTLNLGGLSGSGYTLKAISLDLANTQGQPVAGLTGPASWTIASASGGIAGFVPGGSQFAIDSSQFFGGGVFSLSLSGNDLVLNFTPVPEPSTYALMLSGLALAGLRWRRKTSRNRGS
ncbi:MAG: hypothetical protein JWM88_1048 [Verrucomicrobia bacterium]|nr:hypothetical protein [Verrucomicrobiota bacterium]